MRLCRPAPSLRAKALGVSSRSGTTARILSKFRPEAPILAFTPERTPARRMSLYRGVEPVVVGKCSSPEQMVGRALQEIRERGIASRGGRLVFVYGSASGELTRERAVRSVAQE